MSPKEYGSRNYNYLLSLMKSKDLLLEILKKIRLLIGSYMVPSFGFNNEMPFWWAPAAM